MFIRYHNYSHDPGEVELSRTGQVLMTDAGTPYALRETWELRGQLVGSSSTDMNTKLAALRAAYENNDGRDLTLFLDDTGTNKSTISVANANTIGGVTVTRFDLPTGRAAAYVTFLPYLIQLTFDRFATAATTTIKSFEESIVRSGGGPRYGTLEPNIGRPVRQLLKRSTAYRLEQVGSAVGLYARPDVPRPLWPQWQIGSPRVVLSSPRRRRNVYTDWKVSWRYVFESPIPLGSGPNRWGTTYGS